MQVMPSLYSDSGSRINTISYYTTKEELLTSFAVVAVCLLLLWENTATLFNLKQAMYVFGTMTIILLTRQFLTHPEGTEDHLLSTSSNLTSSYLVNPAVAAFIYWPFFIGFGFKFSTFVSFLILSMSRYLAYLLFRVFVGVLVLIYRWAIIHVYVSIIAILLYFDDMIDIK